MTNLTPGKHKLFFRAWDLQNNSASAELEFEVVEGLDISISDVYAYPNPITDVVNIVIEHDRPLAPTDIQLFMYDLSGRLVYRDNMNMVTDSSSEINIKFDLDASVSDGLYFIRVLLNDANGKKSSKTAKIFVNKQ